MISLKKGFFALSFGIGMAVSLNAWALPPCSTCQNWLDQCALGVTTACNSYDHYGCDLLYPPGSCDA